MNNEAIKKGDIVDVHFNTTGSEFKVEIVCAPTSVGEEWVLKRHDGKIVYVMQYDKMVRISVGD